MMQIVIIILLELKLLSSNQSQILHDASKKMLNTHTFFIDSQYSGDPL